MKTKIQSFLAALFLLAGVVNAQCVMTSQYGSATAPTTGSVNFSTCSFFGEYSPLNSAAAATTYTCSITNSGYVTITQGSATGPVVAFGASPLTWSTTVAGTYYAHWAQNAACATSVACQTTTVAYVGPSAACTNPAAGGTAQCSPAMACPGQNINLSLNGASVGSGLTYQWQSSATSGGPWTNIAGATNGGFSTTQSTPTYYRCEVICSAGTPAYSAQVFVDMNSFLNCYCNSAATSAIYDEEIYNVTVNGGSTDPLYATTNACTTIAPGPGSILGGYSNFKTLPIITTVTTGQSVAFSVVQDECDGAPYYNNGIGIWIDFDHNGSFTDAGEAVFIEQATAMGPRTVNGTFTIPITAMTGNTAMRVICAEGYSATSWTPIAPCLTYGYGETEDYLINIIAATPCAGTPDAGDALASATTVCPSAPVNLSLDSATVASGISYQWLSAPSASGPWTAITGANNSTHSTNISADTYFACVLTCATSSASDTSTSVLVLSTPFFQCYCNTVNAGGAGSLMDNVAFGNGGASFWNNNTSTTQPTASPYYSAFTTGPDVIQGMDYSMGVTIQAPLVYTGAIVSVWIDYNHSGSYEPTEWTQVGTNIAGNTTGTVNITIPMTAMTGNTGMRVRSRGNFNQNGPGDACTNMGSGETEDYVINILPAPDCANPTGITATSAVDSIMTNWNWAQTVLPLTGFNMQLVEAGMSFASGTTYVIDANTTDTLVDPSFIAGQSFEIYLQSVCGQDTSYFIGPIPIVMPMTNNDMCDAAAIPVDGHPYIFNNTGATVNPAEASVVPPATGAQTTTGWDNQNLNLTTWFTFTAPASGNVRINSTALNYNGQVAVYAATDCAITGSFTLQGANDDDLDGANQAPNFTICGLTPGDTYYILHDAFNNTAGNYAIAISAIDLNAGVEGEVLEICYGDTVSLFNGIANYQIGGTWSQTIPTLGLQGSDFVSTGLATVMFEFTYTMQDGCASDESNAYVNVYPASSAGTNGTFTVCKNEPFNLLAGLGGTVDFGGFWLDPSNNPIAGNIDTASNIPGNFNYDYIVSNGVCPADTSTVLVVVDGSCDFTAGIETLAGSFVVYPNPTSSTVFVDNSLGLALDKIELIDMSGRVVLAVNKGSFSNELAELNVSNLTTGVYTVKLSAGQQIFNQRLIKQ
ncbi:MAG: hypothetical protein RIT34_70 [Bacteroidota bacterium]|jgi:hypothetical protein